MMKRFYELSERTTQPRQNSIGRRLFLVGLMLTTATGCKNLVQRSQSPDNFSLPLSGEKKKKNEAGYIGDICAISGLEYAQVDGIGLAVALKETGSNPKPSSQRDFLVEELKSKNKDFKIEPLLAGKDTELVLMKGLLPPGIRKGEKFDIEVIVLGGTEATSLDNGFITPTRLRPMKKLGKSMKQGHVIAMGKGRILVDALFESRNDKSNQLHGFILGGGVALEDRPMGLLIRSENYTPKTTTMISRAINAQFTYVDKNGRHGVAEPKSDRFVEIMVPEAYQHNIGRFLQVVTNTVHSETANERLARMEKFEKQLLDPTQSAITAVRLEALGKDGIPILKRALRHPDLEIKFNAAQSLAYLGETDGIDHLRFVAEKEPAFRWHALTALASMQQREAGAALTELMHVKSAETRYGAFTAMLARSPEDPIVNGEWIGDFYLHRVPSETTSPLLHFARVKRPEIVLFGENQTVGDNFLFVESRMTIRATGHGTVSISRYSAERGEEHQVCSNQVGDLVATLGHAGMGYGDLLKMFRSAKNSKSLSSRLVVNAIPRLGRSYVPGESAEEPAPEESEHYFTDALPELFRSGKTDSDKKTLTKAKTASSKTSTEDQSKPTTLGRMKNWFSGDK